MAMVLQNSIKGGASSGFGCLVAVLFASAPLLFAFGWRGEPLEFLLLRICFAVLKTVGSYGSKYNQGWGI